MRGVRDDVGFCWNLDQMKNLIAYLETQDTLQKPIGPIVAAISPHDDYLYAGRVYESLFHRLRVKEVVIFGVTHRTVRTQIGDPQGVIIMDTFRSWTGVRGPVSISPLRDFIEQRLRTEYVLVNNRAHELEHSIEALLPFLQYYNPGIKITPIMITAMPFGRMSEISDSLAKIIADYLRIRGLELGKDFAFLVSSDANHYGVDFDNRPFGEDSAAHQKGTDFDRELAWRYLAGPSTEEAVEHFTEEMPKVVWCGRYCIPFGLLVAQKAFRSIKGGNLKGEVLVYSDTYTEAVLPLRHTGMGTTAPFSLKHWVGFLSAVFAPE